ncbi:RNA polymerase sigma factor [Taklimakanibacter deserti]|uniref:RNA polymerase sigma factor n=1 Tax=Taklimakanibacter deserti TaxID=2267839 RepID=UPI000E654ABE
MSASDLDLVRLAQDGDRAAFRLLLERHYGLLYRVAYRFLGNRAEAEDAAQEMAMTLAEKIGSFRGGSRFSTWIYQIVLNHCRDQVRRQKSLGRMQTAFVEVEAHRTADWVDSDRRVRWLYRAIDRLKPDLKETALLVLAEEMSHAEAGDVLGIKEATVSWRMHEVRKQLSQMATTNDD